MASVDGFSEHSLTGSIARQCRMSAEVIVPVTFKVFRIGLLGGLNKHMRSFLKCLFCSHRPLRRSPCTGLQVQQKMRAFAKFGGFKDCSWYRLKKGGLLTVSFYSR